MKKYAIILITLICSFLYANLVFAAGQPHWTRRADFGGVPRWAAASFSIANKGYVGTGHDGYGGLLSDFWEYDPSANTWTQKADFGGGTRYLAAGFSTGTKGYMGLGVADLWAAGNIFYKPDFWEYDPSANTWTQKADFGGGNRAKAVSFSMGNKGYVGTGDEYASGKNVCKSDFWEYDPSANTWTQKADFGGGNRSAAVSFSIGNKGYVGTGAEYISGVSYNTRSDFWEYDPSANTWTQKADFGGGAYADAFGVSIGSKGYIGTGGNDSLGGGFWEYDPVGNAWTRKADFGGAARAIAVGFSAGNKGYIGTGQVAGDYGHAPASDFWEYDPSGIFTGDISGGIIHPGSSAIVPFNTELLSFNPGNVFTAYLSDASGSFANEVPIGSLAGVDASGNITVTIPFGTPQGTGYRIRVKSSDPAVQGTDNGCDLAAYNVIVNSWSACTNREQVALTLGCPFPSACTSMQFSNDGLVWSDPEVFASVRADWNVNQGVFPADGPKTIFARFQGAGGAWSGTCSDTIILDTTPPIAAISGNPSSPTASDHVEITVSGEGVVAYKYKLNAGPYSNEIPVGYPVELLGLAEETYTLCIIAKDAAGNWQSEGSATTIVWIMDADYGRGLWTRRANFGGTERSGAVGFAIGDKGYMGTGDQTISGLPGYRSDFWEYDPAADTWTQKASFGGGARSRAVGFATGSKGYVGTGRDDSSIKSDFWEYDPSTNAWTQKAAFQGGPRSDAVGIGVAGKGYIGTGGYLDSKRDFWEYDPSANAWTRKADFPGAARSGATGFSTGSKGYVGLGDSLTNDFWEYDPKADEWTQRADFEGTPRYYATGFSMGSKGYIGLGEDGSGYKYDFWEHNPATNKWSQIAYFSSVRYRAPGFSIGEKGYVGTGYDCRDFWEYTPSGIHTGPMPSSIFAPGSSIIVPFTTVTLSFNPGNVFTAYLSDASGSFANEVTIGSLTTTDPSGNITATIPGNASIGVGYRIRVKSSDQPIQGRDNGADLNVNYIFINSGSAYAAYATATLTLGCPFPLGCTSMKFSNDASKWSDPEVFAQARGNWNLDDGVSSADGLRTVFARFQEAGGTWSAIYSDAIFLDTASPVAAASGFPESPTRSSTATIAVSGTGVVAYKYKLDAGEYSSEIGAAIPIALAGLSEGPHTLRVIAKDAAGNWQAEESATTHTWIVDSDYGKGVWTQKADFLELLRSQAVGLSIGSKGYIGLGRSDSFYKSDIREYDPVTNTWTQKADFGGSDGLSAVSFSIGSKGYVGTGQDHNFSSKSDFWEYDPTANTWTQKADFGGGTRYGGVGFSVVNKGYIGTGSDGYSLRSDFWEYDPETNMWTQKANFGGTARSAAVGFSIGNKGYIGTGWSNPSSPKSDFWEYDPTANTWTQKADFAGTARWAATGFAIGDKGYIGAGRDYSYATCKSDFWECDPTANTWTQKADFGGGIRCEAASFSIGNIAYTGTGQDKTTKKSDLWEYIPSGIYSGKISSDIFLPGSSIIVPFTTATLSFNSGNTFTAYLSDTSGRFTNEVAVGSLASTDPSGSITVTIPFERPPGTGYRIRIKSSDPSHVGFDNGTGLTCTLTQQSDSYLFLNSGWNFISFPRTPPDTVEAALTAVSPSTVDIIWGYDNEHKEWRKWKSSGGVKNTLFSLQTAKGYWVYLYGAPCIINMTGWNWPASSSIPLYAGWNLIGHLGSDNADAASRLNSIAGKWDILWGWNSGEWSAKHRSPALPAPIRALTTLDQGKAYWIKVRQGAETIWAQ